MSGSNNLINTPIPFIVADGGTGKTSFVAYTPICGGTTSTGAFQSVASLSTSGKALVSSGAGALPTFTTATNTNGIVLQCVQTSVKTLTKYSSSSFTSIGLSASITPGSSSNKVLVLASIVLAGTGTSSGYLAVNLMRGATAICQNTDATVLNCTAVSAFSDGMQTFSIFYIDSPATTSSTTYSIDAACITATGGVPSSILFGINSYNEITTEKVGGASTITVMELS